MRSLIDTILNHVAEQIGNEAVTAWAKKRREDNARKPSDIRSCAGKQVGDCLYSMEDCDNSMATYLILYIDDLSHARIVMVDDHLDGAMLPVSWACQEHQDTPEMALAFAIRNDRSYCGPLLQFAEEAHAALTGGQDITPFLDGKPNQVRTVRT